MLHFKFYAGLLLLIISGLHIGWGIWRFNYYGDWSYQLHQRLFVGILSSWYIGAIIGCIIGAIGVNYWKTKISYVSKFIYL